MGADPSLTPDAVQAHAFTAGFRGYDQAEVRQFLHRVATELRALNDQVERLESMWHSAEERAARPPVLDEDTLMAAVGEETAAILRAARSAAADVRNRAAADADRIVAEAHEVGTGVRTEAEAVLGRETAAAQAAATQILDAARSEAAQLVDRARTDADSLRASAQQEKQLTIEGAAATRERILDDLSRRRRVASVQIEQLRAGRERLIEVYALVRRTLDDVQQELSRADAEARAAADAAGRRMQSETPEADSELSEPESLTAAASEQSDDETGAPAPSAEVPDVAEADLDAPTMAASSVDLTEPPPPPPPSPSEPAMQAKNADAEPVSGKSAKAGSKASRLFRHHAPARAETAIRAEALSPPPPPAPPAVPHLRVVRVVHEPEAVETIEGEAAAAQAAAAEAAPSKTEPGEPATVQESTPAEAPEGPAPGSTVDLLFARIRAGREADEKTETAAEPAPATAAATTPTDDASDHEEVDSEVPRSDADEALLQKREAAVMDLEMSLTRKLKRSLQDEQNDLLDRLRSLRQKPTAARLLPDVDSQTARYASAAQPLVDKAAAAGVAFAAELRGKKASKSGAPLVADLAKEAAASIVDPLRRRLEQAISTADGDDQTVLVEALGSAYREWKSQRIERIAGDTLAAAFSRGTWHEVPAGTPLRWVVEDVDGPCPDCDDDALAGSLPKGEAFPTGQPHPPAHSGCRCLLVPAEG